MTSRLQAILRLLSGCSDYSTIEQIAEATGAGVRTIHRDLESLERSLSLRGVRMERRRGYGVRLIDPLPKRLMEGVGAGRLPGLSESGQRPLMILLYLIIAGDWIKLAEIAHVLYVSDSTVSSDISNLEFLLPDSIQIERQKGTGVRIAAEEVSLRLLFLSAFPSLVPVYLISGSERGMENGEERLIRLLRIREYRDRFSAMIGAAEQVLGYRFSPEYMGLIYSHLYLLTRRLPLHGPLEDLPVFELSVPEPYLRAATALFSADSWELPGLRQESEHEISFLARILSSCEVAATTHDSVEEYVGDIATRVEAVVEHTLSRLEESRKIWLHDDRALTNYLRMTIAAAARRIDLGIPELKEIGLHPYPGMEDSPEAAALVSQFMLNLGALLGDPQPSIVRREIQEAALALSAHVEVLQSRHASEIRVKILCIEGLGMSSYIGALVRDVLPRGAMVDTQWDPDFETGQQPGQYDLVISSFPLQVRGARHVIINGDSSPEEIRAQLREAVQDLGKFLEDSAGQGASYTPERRPMVPEKAEGLSLPVIMSVIGGFFVETRRGEQDLLTQTVNALNSRGDCDAEMMISDFKRRESYGSLVFEELNIRILHCRTEGVPEPRAGVIQTVPMEPTILVLAAPLTASPVQTHALSELVIALTDYPDFPEILSCGSKREIQARLLTLFSQKIT